MLQAESIGDAKEDKAAKPTINPTEYIGEVEINSRAVRELRATTLIDDLDEKLVPIKQDLNHIAEYYMPGPDGVMTFGTERILWIDFQPHLSMNVITVYIGQISLEGIWHLVNQIYAIGGDSIAKMTLWTEWTGELRIIECKSKRWH